MWLFRKRLDFGWDTFQMYYSGRYVVMKNIGL